MQNHSSDVWMVATREGFIPLGLENFGDRGFQWAWGFLWIKQVGHLKHDGVGSMGKGDWKNGQ